MSWMTEYLGPNGTVEELIPKIGALIVGHNTYGGDDPHRDDPDRAGKAFGGGWDGPQFVLTHNTDQAPTPGVTFVSELDTAVQLARDAAGEGYVNILGANVAEQCLRAGLVDEILICIAPVMLGDGVRLLDHPGGLTVKLERIGLSRAELATNLWFRVVRS